MVAKEQQRCCLLLGTSTWKAVLILSVPPCLLANSSATKNPALCRVLLYCSPGLPRPTINKLLPRDGALGRCCCCCCFGRLSLCDCCRSGEDLLPPRSASPPVEMEPNPSPLPPNTRGPVCGGSEGNDGLDVKLDDDPPLSDGGS